MVLGKVNAGKMDLVENAVQDMAVATKTRIDAVDEKFKTMEETIKLASPNTAHTTSGYTFNVLESKIILYMKN